MYCIVLYCAWGPVHIHIPNRLLLSSSHPFLPSPHRTYVVQVVIAPCQLAEPILFCAGHLCGPKDARERIEENWELGIGNWAF
jgi:hypothetical protein